MSAEGHPETPKAGALAQARGWLGAVAKGGVIVLIIAFAALFLYEHYGPPAMLMALLLGIAIQFVYEDETCRPGVDFMARTVLRLGVALLGLRISWQMLEGLGAGLALWVVLGVAVTILTGWATARAMGRRPRFGVLAGGSVAICGASAAMAIAAVLPKDERSESNLTFVVVAVTVLSTLAMIIYPIIVDIAGLTPHQAGFFLGATIHDVAQVVGAGYSVSAEVGDMAVVVKLLRVALLGPVIFIVSMAFAGQRGDGDDGKRPPLLPWFVWAFLGLAALNSVVAPPAAVATLSGDASRWMLLCAVAAVGMKTSLRDIMQVGRQAIGLVVALTLLQAGFFLALIIALGVAA